MEFRTGFSNRNALGLTGLTPLTPRQDSFALPGTPKTRSATPVSVGSTDRRASLLETAPWGQARTGSSRSSQSTVRITVKEVSVAQWVNHIAPDDFWSRKPDLRFSPTLPVLVTAPPTARIPPKSTVTPAILHSAHTKPSRLQSGIERVSNQILRFLRQLHITV